MTGCSLQTSVQSVDPELLASVVLPLALMVLVLVAALVATLRRGG